MSTTSTPGSSNRSASRANASAREQIVQMIEDDHKLVKKAFRDFEKLDAERDQEECQALVEQTCAALEVHTTLEEELLYPAAREALKEKDLIAEAEVEHASAKQLIEQLKQLQPDDEKYSATFTVLGEYVNHHIKEEEKEMLPQLERARGIDWQALCDEMNGRRAELEEQLMPQQAGADEDDDSETAVDDGAGGAARRASSSSSKGAGARPTASGSRRGASGAQERPQATGDDAGDAESDA